ncbi:hypothetical protein V8G54_002701, partial [Vigna mungo]
MNQRITALTSHSFHQDIQKKSQAKVFFFFFFLFFFFLRLEAPNTLKAVCLHQINKMNSPNKKKKKTLHPFFIHPSSKCQDMVSKKMEKRSASANVPAPQTK